ncbi:2562_t:CDS:1 [Paraglomus occultum]|uniref:2562_t:CDS:1 n=1 Tax=Paraglomus occultum TaxID=144539 RepID=A0A9N9AYU1_9GLOM|nr:2562_t:CDS:1 [Paraglomus occultum]
MTIQTIYNNYKRARDGDHFTSTATLNFVPTSVFIYSYDSVRSFLTNAYDPNTISIKEKVKNMVISADTIVEETEATITFISGECFWMFGHEMDVDKDAVKGKKITVDMVTFIRFEYDKIQSVRMYWDQLSVMRQIGCESWVDVCENEKSNEYVRKRQDRNSALTMSDDDSVGNSEVAGNWIFVRPKMWFKASW